MTQEPIIRTYKPPDREAVRGICRRTGLKGDPVWRYFEGEEVLTTILADYYLDHGAEERYKVY